MKKTIVTLACVVTFFALNAACADAAVPDMLRVGLRYGSTAMFSANLENAVGSGYELGYFEDGRSFVPVGRTDETCISMTAAGTIYVSSAGEYSASGSGTCLGPWHVQLGGYDDFDEAAEAAGRVDGWPVYLDGDYVVRTGCYDSKSEASDAAGNLGGEAVRSSSDGVMVTRTRSTQILFEFDCGGEKSLGVMPQAGRGEKAETWFKGYKYNGGFEYVRPDGGNLRVINVVDLEDYVKGVVPYEMNGDWPLAALEAQAVCARTFACQTTKHASYDFDVCSGICCQVYNGVNTATDRSNQAVDNTAGVCIWYDGKLIEAVYHSSDGGATEDAKNVWGGDVPYLKGKEDPYEALTSIPNYSWTVTYTPAELTWVLQHSGYSIGTVADVYVAERTALGNVSKVVFTDTTGKTLTVTGQACSNAFYSTTYGKNVRSLRFTISGGSGETSGGFCVNSASNRLDTLAGAAVISGGGTRSTLSNRGWYAVTGSGTVALEAAAGTSGGGSGDLFVITGTGNGHNVGMSQYGAKAMAENGYSYEDILSFYYTDVTIK